MPGGWEWLIVVGVLLLLFGASRLPTMARSIGQSARVFRSEMRGMKTDDEARKAAEQQQAPPAALPQAQEVKQDTAAEPGKASQPGSAPGSTGQ